MTATSAMFHQNAMAQVAGARSPVASKSRAALTLVAAFGALIAGFLFALLAIHGLWVKGDQPAVTAGFNAFALMFVMALAIERLIQPFVPILGPDTTVAKAKLIDAKARDVPHEVASAQGEVTDSRSKTALVTWGVATGLACLLSASLNVTLLHAMTIPAGTHSPYWVDLLVTGLVVGAGTKPLNDLWSRLQSKSA
ncbi:MAG TPA: hypothetical protein VGL80_16140 [Pseudonocardiaceae bacterium]